MSYEPTQWAVGDKITAAKMNKIENGIAEGGGAVIATTEQNVQGTFITSYTWQELYDIINNGKMVLIKISNDLFTVTAIASDANAYYINTIFGQFSCFSPDENPAQIQK